MLKFSSPTAANRGSAGRAPARGSEARLRAADAAAGGPHAHSEDPRSPRETPTPPWLACPLPTGTPCGLAPRPGSHAERPGSLSAAPEAPSESLASVGGEVPRAFPSARTARNRILRAIEASPSKARGWAFKGSFRVPLPSTLYSPLCLHLHSTRAPSSDAPRPQNPPRSSQQS